MTIQELIKKYSRPRKRLNKELMLRVARRFKRLKHEEHYNQDSFGKQTSCGTAGCIAYHVLVTVGANGLAVVRGRSTKGLYVYGLARNALGLTNEQAADLFGFGGSGWPVDYYDRYQNAISQVSDERPSRVVGEMLEKIATGAIKL